MKYLLLSFLLIGSLSAQTRQVTMQGTVRILSDREISIALATAKIETFKVTSSTKFNDGLTMKVLQRGDRLVVQGTQDRDGILTATTISLDAAAMAADAIALRLTPMTAVRPYCGAASQPLTPARVPTIRHKPRRWRVPLRWLTTIRRTAL
jgi:hypothetical protein